MKSVNRFEELAVNFALFIISGLFIIAFFFLVNYDKSINPDIYNYSNNFFSKNYSYDLGFELYQSLLRDLFKFDFNSFWHVTLVLICLFYFFLGYGYQKFPLFIVNFFFLAETFGTQVRFFLGGLIIVLLLEGLKRNNAIKILLISICCLFHYGLFLIMVIYLAAILFEKKLTAKFFYENKLLLSLILVVSYFLISPVVNLVLPYTRFDYYLGSMYMVSKSLISFIFTLATLFFVVWHFSETNPKDKHHRLTFFIAIFLLISVAVSSSIAVLSGRILLIYVLYELVLIKVMFSVSVTRKHILICMAIVLISIAKIGPDMLRFVNSI